MGATRPTASPATAGACSMADHLAQRGAGFWWFQQLARLHSKHSNSGRAFPCTIISIMLLNALSSGGNHKDPNLRHTEPGHMQTSAIDDNLFCS